MIFSVISSCIQLLVHNLEAGCDQYLTAMCKVLVLLVYVYFVLLELLQRVIRILFHLQFYSTFVR